MMTDLNHVVASRDGKHGVLLTEFEGSHKVPNRIAVGFYFSLLLRPNESEESRINVLFGDAARPNSIDPGEFRLPRFDDPERLMLVFAEAAIGEFLDGSGPPAFTPSGVQAAEIPCFSPQFAAWHERSRPSDAVIRDYLVGKMWVAWQFDQLSARFEFADVLRLGAPMAALHKVALVGEGRDWMSVGSGPNHLELRPSPELIRQIAAPERDTPSMNRAVHPPSAVDVSSTWQLLHSDITLVARTRFESGHYADAVEAAFKVVNAEVKRINVKAGGDELDGTALMRKAFGGGSPAIRLDDFSTESGRNIQEGYGHIYAGAMLGIRNPKAHENITISPERAIHLLFLASLLRCRLDERVAPP